MGGNYTEEQGRQEFNKFRGGWRNERHERGLDALMRGAAVGWRETEMSWKKGNRL